MLTRTLAERAELDEKRMPKSWQVIGDILIAKMHRLSEEEKLRTAEAIMAVMPRIRTVCEIRGVEGEFRTPVVRKLAGGSTETVHTEHGIKYSMDVTKVMFSKGNEHERHILAGQVGSNEVIVDMFAGIGYFSLPLAKRAKSVISIEKSPAAFAYLVRNIELNKLTNITPINGDCRETHMTDIADRILLGYLPGTEKFLPAALRIAKSGATIHFHNTAHKTETGIIEQQIKVSCEKSGYDYDRLHVRKVKGYAPNVYHMAAEFAVLK